MTAPRVRRSSPVAFGGLALAAGGALAVGVLTLSPDVIVASSFDRVLNRLEVVATAVSRRAPYDGISGSEEFWLGIANPDIVKTVAVGQPLIIRSGSTERRLVITDVRETTVREVPVAATEETHIATAYPGSARVFDIICRDTRNPTVGEIHLKLQNGELSFSIPPLEDTVL
jgi:hypothetical protein